MAATSTPTEHRIRLDAAWIEQLPLDLYIPPVAFEVWLDRFEGPLDFLLYLVKKNGINLLDFDIAPIAAQYIEYINRIRHQEIELAAEYLVMAALLADLKSRLLLPKSDKLELEDDPRQALIQRLEEYAKVKDYAHHLNDLPVHERNVFDIRVAHPANVGDYSVSADQTYAIDLLAHAITTLIARAPKITHNIQAESVSLESRIDDIRQLLRQHRSTGVSFYAVLNPAQGRVGIVVSFVALLELIRLGEIHVKVDEHEERKENDEEKDEEKDEKNNEKNAALQAQQHLTLYPRDPNEHEAQEHDV